MVEVSISNLLNEADVSISNPPFNSQNRQVEEHFLNDSSTPSFYPGECGLFSDIASTSSISSSAVFKSVMKAIGPFMLDRMQINDNILSRHNQDKLCSKMTTSTEHLVLCADYVRIDSYTCKSVIDPLWPLCMYELRGRCNNDECPWQHTKDYSESDGMFSFFLQGNKLCMFQVHFEVFENFSFFRLSVWLAIRSSEFERPDRNFFCLNTPKISSLLG